MGANQCLMQKYKQLMGRKSCSNTTNDSLKQRTMSKRTGVLSLDFHHRNTFEHAAQSQNDLLLCLGNDMVIFLSGLRYFLFDNFYDSLITVVIARMVDQLDKKVLLCSCCAPKNFFPLQFVCPCECVRVLRIDYEFRLVLDCK